MKRSKKHDTTRYIPVHIAAASNNSSEAYRLGAVGLIEKPVDPDALDKSFSNIEKILEGKLKKLLLVGDYDDQRKSILELLSGKDLEISEAETGEQALEMVRNKQFDCVVLDLGINDMPGFEFLSGLRQRMGDMPPVIVYSAKDLTMEEEAELQKYAESGIIKGVRSPDRLLEETALFLHRVESELSKGKQKDIQMFRDQDSTLNGKTILLVDDDMRNVFAISSVLEQKGMNIVAGKNGRDGLEKLKSARSIDLVLMDIMMPEMDRYMAMGEIRKTRKYKDLPIIALTAKAMKGDRNKCIEAGASDYLAKPVDTDKLISLLRVWLHG